MTGKFRQFHGINLRMEFNLNIICKNSAAILFLEQCICHLYTFCDQLEY